MQSQCPHKKQEAHVHEEAAEIALVSTVAKEVTTQVQQWSRRKSQLMSWVNAWGSLILEPQLVWGR